MAVKTEVRVSYSVGVKANLGNYESADVHLSESESYSVEGMSEEEIETLKDERYEALRDKLTDRISAEYATLKAISQ